MNKSDLIAARKKWDANCQEIRQMTPVMNAHETPTKKQQRTKKLLANYNEFVKYYFPHYAKCECGKFQINAANKVRRTPNIKATFKWARGHAKSTHFDMMIPMWLKAMDELRVMVLVGKSETSAKILLSDLQAELENNQRYIADFGKQKKVGSWEEGEFVTADHCAFFSRGRGQSPRGLRYRDRRPDYIVIDDLDDDELCNNESRVNKLTDWVKEALFGALDGGRGRFIMVGNLIGKVSVLANIWKAEGVFQSQTNARKANGEPTWNEKWSKKEMMNNPITEGAVFKNNWIQWKKLPSLRKYDQLVAYCDPSFKGSSKNDYKAIKLWGVINTELHHIDAFVRQCSVAEMVRWFYDLHERMPEGVICDYYIEANFLQDIILDDFAREGKIRGYQLPIRGDHRKKPDKFQRVEAISPLWERGFVWYNIAKQNDKDTLTALEQTLAFEKGSRVHDDAPDADEGAIYKLQKSKRENNFAATLGRRKTARNSW